MELAIIGTTACGKSDLAINIAKKTNGVILSLDSLSVYKEIDIASAKPSLQDMQNVKHFGIDVIFPNEIFNVAVFFDLYKKASKTAQNSNSPLLIVGGTSFYLKALLSGLSDRPTISEENQKKIFGVIKNLEKAYKFISTIDPKSAEKMEKNDRYRIEKWHEIYYETGELPSSFLERTKKEPVIKKLSIFEIETDKETLLTRVEQRTEKMIKQGLIDEAARLEKKYTREPNCMKSIGIKESLEYFDGLCSLGETKNEIIKNTLKLAKRQRTFNRTQFSQTIIKKPLNEMENEILGILQKN